MFDDGIKLHHDSNDNNDNTNVIKDIYTPSSNFVIISHKLNEIKEYYKQTTQLRKYMYMYILYLDSKQALHVQKLFDIINQCVCFLDKVNQIEIAISESVNCKRQIIENVIDVTKEITQKEVCDYLNSTGMNIEYDVIQNETFNIESVFNFDTFNRTGIDTLFNDESRSLTNANVLQKLKDKLKTKTKENIITSTSSSARYPKSKTKRNKSVNSSDNSTRRSGSNTSH